MSGKGTVDTTSHRRDDAIRWGVWKVLYTIATLVVAPATRVKVVEHVKFPRRGSLLLVSNHPSPWDPMVVPWSAVRQVHNLGVDLQFNETLHAAIDVAFVDRYFLDAANTAAYTGHTVANLRFDWRATDDLRASLRVDNVFDTAYADRADYAFGNYRYFPARDRALFLSLDFATH